MTTRVNPPAPQPGPILFVVVCVAGVVVAVRGMATLRVGTEQWWVGFLVVVMAAFAFLFIDGGWLYIQRELTFSDDTVVVRRWIEVLLQRPGVVLALDGRTQAEFTLENIASLRLTRDGVPVTRLTLGYWPRPRIRELFVELRARGVAIKQYWVGEYPPNTG